MNTVTIAGNLTRDPELRFTQAGTPVANFSVAYNRFIKGRDGGDNREEVSFFDCVAWDTLGQNIADSLHKGDRVVITGRLQQRTWENDEGEKRSKVEIVAEEVSPSLRWASATVAKNEKAGGSTSFQENVPTSAYEEPF